MNVQILETELRPKQICFRIEIEFKPVLTQQTLDNEKMKMKIIIIVKYKIYS